MGAGRIQDCQHPPPPVKRGRSGVVGINDAYSSTMKPLGPGPAREIPRSQPSQPTAGLEGFQPLTTVLATAIICKWEQEAHSHHLLLSSPSRYHHNPNQRPQQQPRQEDDHLEPAAQHRMPNTSRPARSCKPLSRGSQQQTPYRSLNSSGPRTR